MAALYHDPTDKVRIELELEDDLPAVSLDRDRMREEYIQKKLKENNGNIAKTATEIGLERSHLHKKLKEHGIR